MPLQLVFTNKVLNFPYHRVLTLAYNPIFYWHSFWCPSLYLRSRWPVYCTIRPLLRWCSVPLVKSMHRLSKLKDTNCAPPSDWGTGHQHLHSSSLTESSGKYHNLLSRQLNSALLHPVLDWSRCTLAYYFPCIHQNCCHKGTPGITLWFPILRPEILACLPDTYAQSYGGPDCITYSTTRPILFWYRIPPIPRCMHQYVI